MNLGGLQESSLIDYPGKVSCVLFFSGCNFQCPYCHNPCLASGELTHSQHSEENYIYNFLEKRVGFLDGVVISGGEPTLAEDLRPLCEKLKEMDYPVKLDTNGSHPNVMKSLIDDGLIDYIAMDIKSDPYNYPSAIKKDLRPECVLESIDIIMQSTLAYEFRTTCVRPFIYDSTIEIISKTIEGADLYVLQGFQNVDILKPEYFNDVEVGYREDELLAFKRIAKPWVKKCLVRKQPQSTRRNSQNKNGK